MTDTELSATDPSQEEKNWAIIAHVSNAAGMVLSVGALAWLGPLFILLIKGDSSRFIASHSRETLNYSITALLINLAAVVAMLATCGFLFFVPWITGIATLIVGVVGGIQGGIAADQGDLYVYPMTHRFLK